MHAGELACMGIVREGERYLAAQGDHLVMSLPLGELLAGAARGWQPDLIGAGCDRGGWRGCGGEGGDPGGWRGCGGGLG